MPFNTFSVATAVTPSVIETYFSHYLHRKPLREKPTAHISYHEGLRLVRQFLDYSAKHSIEDLQAFTAQWVPVPTWVRTQDAEVPPPFLVRSANVVRKQLGPHGIELVGGDKWWQWRRPGCPLHAEWIEMKAHHHERERAGARCDRAVLYVHGGAYYFGSVDEHRYQMQRHARKLKARVLAPRYRLAPQFPFPCGLHDCIAAYFYLLEHFEPGQVLLAGDSAGGGMVLAMLVTLRDQGCPLPAGTILLSPWVDLTHSFPSTGGSGAGDYIPPGGFHHKPSMAWPPPPVGDEEPKKAERKFTQPVEQPFDVVELPATPGPVSMPAKPGRDHVRDTAHEHRPKAAPIPSIPGTSQRLELVIDDKTVVIREQIQMYAKNDLLAHPLVSAVQQPSLGGLPPMLIQVGGAELLRDEQIYLAHKAANPTAYPPSDVILDTYDPERTTLNLYPPTDVQLQVWEDLCHVPHTLSFTRPAKYMYRSVAQFGAWALARAQHKPVEILADDAASVISDADDGDEFKDERGEAPSGAGIGDEGVISSQTQLTSIGAVGKAGDELPPFKDHMIRQRVNRHGTIFPLPRRSDLECLRLDPNTIGAVKPGPVRKWLAKRAENEQKFAGEYKKIVKKKAKEQKGWDTVEPGENPPPTALVNRRKAGAAPEQKKKGKSWGLAMWSGWGSSHDECAIHTADKVLEDREQADDEEDEASDVLAAAGLVRADSSVRTARNKSVTHAHPAVSPATLAVPGHELDSESRSERRRSSASVLSAPWSRKDRDDALPRSSHRSAPDPAHPPHDRNSIVSPFFALSRRSSAASGRLAFHARPGSVAEAGSPNSHDSQPPMSTSKLQTHGKPSSHLRHPSPNASTMTRESVASSDRESTRSAESPRSKAAPTFGTSAVEPPSDPPGTSAGTSAAGVTRGAKQDPEPHLPGSETDVIPTLEVSQPPPHETGTVLGGNSPSPSSSRPASMPPDHARASHLRTPQEDLVHPASPLVHPPDQQNAAVSPPGTLEHRDSRVGSLGADGMPTPVFPGTSGAPRPAPFKIRNPVSESRASAEVPAQPPSEPVTPVEGPRALPFKMRHVIYDSRVAPVGSKPPGFDAAAAATAAAAAAAAAASNGASQSENSSTPFDSDAPPGSAVTSPPATSAVVVAAQHAAARTVATHSMDSPVDDGKAMVESSPAQNTHADVVPTHDHPHQSRTVTPVRPVPPRPSFTGPPPAPPPKDSPKLGHPAAFVAASKSPAHESSRDHVWEKEVTVRTNHVTTASGSTRRKPVTAPIRKLSKDSERWNGYHGTPSTPSAGAARAGAGAAKMWPPPSERARSLAAMFENGTIGHSPPPATTTAFAPHSGIRPESGVLPMMKPFPAAAPSPPTPTSARREGADPGARPTTTT